MVHLNPICEEILKFIIENADKYANIIADTIFNKFSPQYESRIIINALKKLASDKHISLTTSHCGEIIRVKLESSGEFYFINKDNNPPQTITITNSNGVTIGNNNTVNVNVGADFSEAYALIEQLDTSNKEILIELISTIQDCLEHSKPLPKGKLSKIADIFNNAAPLLTLIGNIIASYLGA